MTTPLAERMKSLITQRQAILARLEVPARAAVNAMMDANMKRTADPLAAVLFELDSISADLDKSVKEATPDEFKAAMLQLLTDH